MTIKINSFSNLNYTRVATNLVNLEYSGILREFCATTGKIVTKYFRSSFKYLCKTAVDSVNRTLGEGHYYIYFLLR